MTNLEVLKNHLALGEDYSDELLQVLQSALDEITTSRVKLLELGGYSPAGTANLLTGCGKSSQYISKFEYNSSYSVSSSALINLQVAHENQYTVISQLLALTYLNNKWSAQVVFDDFPRYSSPAETLDALSDRLIRLGLATRVSDSLRARLEALWTEN
ncbi:Uncharacterised protein [Yersinia frederiksenii]|uniref:hypothetical protein n=1 Tax=Yersinia TaxID=629 RepID=UPI0005EA4DB7|nr:MULTISPECIES: hypothetical protein [Yersinia]CNI33826.1 Uncharacterised protein [Yersinia frederiksenii]